MLGGANSGSVALSSALVAVVKNHLLLLTVLCAARLLLLVLVCDDKSRKHDVIPIFGGGDSLRDGMATNLSTATKSRSVLHTWTQY